MTAFGLGSGWSRAVRWVGVLVAFTALVGGLMATPAVGVPAASVDSPGAGRAVAAVDPDAGNRAASWAEGMIGRGSEYRYWCLKFALDAWSIGAGVPVTRAESARRYWDVMAADQHPADRNAPRGAVQLWDWFGTVDGVYQNWGHAVVSDGHGNVITSPFTAATVQRLTFDQMNSLLGGRYLGWIYPAGSPPVGAPPDGAFVSYRGDVYRVAGGAPVYVNTWDIYGGPQPTIGLSDAQFNALRPVPADGTFIHAQGRGDVYRVAGGAPVYVSTWSAFGGSKPTVGVAPFAIDNAGGGGVLGHLRPVPADGTFVSSAQSGEVYRVAGGAPQYVTYAWWQTLSPAPPVTQLDKAAIDNAGGGSVWQHLRALPADGTFISSAQDGRVYRVAGGAPLYVTYAWWQTISPAPSVTQIDKAAVDNAGGAFPWGHLRPVPADGFLRGNPSGRVFRVRAGRAYYVPSWTLYGGAKPYVDVDDWSVDRCEHLVCTPEGYLDAVAGRVGVVSVTGWATDPNTTGPVTVQVFVDGRLAGSLTASQPRPDVEAVLHRGYSGYGFAGTVPATAGAHRVQVLAVNQPTGVNPTLGEATVTVPVSATSPAGPVGPSIATPVRLLAPASVRRGARFTVAVKASPLAVSRPVRLQYWSGTRWVWFATGRLSTTSVASWRLVYRLRGVARLRAVVPGWTGHRTGVSAVARIRING